MKQSRFTEEQIVKALEEGQKGEQTVDEICRKLGIHKQTYYGWRKKYNGQCTPDTGRRRRFDAHSRRAAGNSSHGRNARSAESSGSSDGNPDSSSLDLSGMIGQDVHGFSGFRDNVDRHYTQLIGFVKEKTSEESCGLFRGPA